MGRPRVCDVSLHLLSFDQLLAPPPPERFSEAETLVSGMEQLMNDLSHRRMDNGVRVTIRLPTSEIEDDTAARIRAAIARYCRLRIRTNENELRAVRRDGGRALMEGGVVAAVTLALSAVLITEEVPDPVRVFLGEGLFLVIAWVALWYPLDVLLTGQRTYVRQNKVLRALMDTDVVVQAAD